MMDFRMDTFLAVCHHMNYTRAAEELHITQPAVSQQIHLLEQSYGVKLFVYEGKQLVLTEEGELLKQAAFRAKHDDAALRERLLYVKEKRRQMRFGATLTIGEFVIPDRLAAYLLQGQAQNVQMVVANTQELLHKLEEGEIDFAFVEGYFEKKNYESRVCRREPFICVKGREYKFRKMPEVFAELLGEPLILREEGSGTREILERYLQERNCSIADFPRRIEINNMHAIKELVKQGCGITFLYEAAAKEELERGGLEIVRLRDFAVSHEFTFIWQRGSLFEEEYEAFFRMFRW